MSINSINIFKQQVSTIPLKIVQSAGWATLAILTLPLTLTKNESSYFFTKKTVEVWNLHTSKTTFKVDKANPNAKASLEATLNDWIQEAMEDRYQYSARKEARKKIFAFLELPLGFQKILHLIGIQSKNILKLNYLDLTSLPDIFNYPCFSKLEYLHLDNNYNITTLPDSIGNLTKLTTLNLSNNRIKTLPKPFFNLKNLSVLCLNNNCLKKLPDDLGNLQGLEKLYIGNQKFSKEGFVLFPVNPNPNIKNTLVTLPDTIGNLKRLIVLSAEDIYLKTLPESLVRLSALTTLNLNDNQLTELPITELPKGFGKLPLTTLHLGNNQLKTLPEEFIHLQALTNLQLCRAASLH